MIKQYQDKLKCDDKILIDYNIGSKLFLRIISRVFPNICPWADCLMWDRIFVEFNGNVPFANFAKDQTKEIDNRIQQYIQIKI
jgi:hypothetical protein